MFIYRSPGSHVLVARTASEFLAMANNDLYVTLMNAYVDARYISSEYALRNPHIHDECAVGELVSCSDHNQCSLRSEFQLRLLKRLRISERTLTYSKPCFAKTPDDLYVLSFPDFEELVWIARELLWILRCNNRLYPLERQKKELDSIVKMESGCVSGLYTSTTVEKTMKHLENTYNEMYTQVTTSAEDVHRVAVCARDWSNYTKV